MSVIPLLPPFSSLTTPDLSYFEEDDAKLKEIEISYRKGELMTGELKKMAIAMLQEYVKGFQDRRKEVSDEVMRTYMTPRELEWKGNPNPKTKVKEGKGKKGEGKEGKEKEKEVKS
jgi:tryptophanyl-tRNA synthetase